MAPSSMLEEILHHDRVIVVTALLSVVALSWLWVALGAGMDISAVEMTRMPRDMVMTPAVWTAGYAALMVSMWFVMMVAMMLPSATPMLLIFARVSRRERAAERPWVPTGIFASGYLAAWACFSVGAVAMQWGLEESGLLSAMMVTTTTWLGAAILITVPLVVHINAARGSGWLPRHQGLYAMPTRKSLIGACVPASAEFVCAFTNPEVSKLVYRYSILPRIVSVIAYSTPAPAVQPLDLPPVVTKGAAPVTAKAREGLPVAQPPVPKTRKRSNATPSRPRIEP